MISKTITFHSLAETPWEGSMTALLEAAGFTATPNLEDSQMIVFNGGSDIGTEIYDETPIMQGVPQFMSNRDKQEIDIFYKYKDPTVLKVGICRGAQLLNCLNGGTLWQDVDNHGYNHSMTILATGQKIQVTSTHHQMMRPNLEKGILIGVSDEATYKAAELAYYPGDVAYDDAHKDTEIVYYPETNSLCIQGHPEYVPNSVFANYCIELIEQYLPKVNANAA